MNKRIDLHELLQKKAYDHAVICTYSFDPIFFEDYCLEKFSSLKNNPNITIILDKKIYDQSLHQESNRPKQANLRYLMHPIDCPGNFHIKLFLFVSKNKGLLVLGSHNFTRPGLTANAEYSGAYEYEVGKNEIHQNLYQAAFKIVTAIYERWPSEMLKSNLSEIRLDAPWLLTDIVSEKDNPQLLSNFDKCLWDQIVQRIDNRVDRISILSRYFDARPDILDKIFEDLNPREVLIYTQNGITTMTKEWFAHSAVKSGSVEILTCLYRDGDAFQNLHAKAIAIEHGNKITLAYGSANFTEPALTKTMKEGNVESLLVLDNLQRKEVSIERLFDPMKTAVRLRLPDDLQTAPSEDDQKNHIKYEMELSEASLEDSKILILAKIPQNYNDFKIEAKLTFHNGPASRIPVISLQENIYSAYINDSMAQLLDNATTVVQLEAYRDKKLIGTSNLVLLINLQDIESGQNIRRERHIKQAQQSIEQFLEVLQNISGDSDPDSMIQFLNYCNIPINFDLPGRMLSFHPRPVALLGKGMRVLAIRDIKIINELHVAVIAFVERHIKKLKLHLENASINGITNFMHILLSVLSVLDSQLERVVQSIELKKEPLLPEEWFSYRKNMDVYLHLTKQVVETFCQAYLPEIYNAKQASKIKSLLAPHSETLLNIMNKLENVRQRIESSRSNGLKVKVDYSTYITPGYFDSTLRPDKWRGYEKEMLRMTAALKEMKLIEVSV